MANTILSVNDKRYIEIGYNIQYYRKHKNLTQERLAKLLDISTKCSLAIKFILNRQTFLSCLFLFFLSFFLSVPEPKGDYHHPPVSCTTH